MGIEQQLRDLLRQAMRQKDAAVVAAARGALSAIANAEAVAAPEPDVTTSAHVAGAALGAGAAEAERAVLDEHARVHLVAADAKGLEDHARLLLGLGRTEEAAAALRGAQALRGLH